MAVSLDIQNAFNSLPWAVIREALARKEFPKYIHRIIDSYLSERTVEYRTSNGGIATRRMGMGVPQGSVLGPTLWNIGYDFVLRKGVQYGCEILCYADDTLILASADTLETAVARANLQTGLVLNRIRRLGLRVTVSKTEAVLFYGRNGKPAEESYLDIGGELIRTSGAIKYLGIFLDSRLRFDRHFEYIETKAARISGMLGRLMPNLHGPSEAKRQLYANAIHAVLLYGAPVWSDALMASGKNRTRLGRVQRSIALRVIAAYRTTSLVASTLLARIPPLHLMAAARSRTFHRVRDLRETREWSEEAEQDIRQMDEVLLLRQWSIYLGDRYFPVARTREAILPHLGAWVKRRHGRVAFHLTQLLTGHGCFGTYLCRIGSVASSLCEHCDEGLPDSAEHTLASCSAWNVEREALRSILGDDLALPSIVGRMCARKDCWSAMSRFAVTVMREKERRERARQARERGTSSTSGADSGE